jgi:CheY-like chemotaxis protein
VVQAAVEAVQPMAEARGVRVEASLDGRAGRARADPDRIQQVAWNLLNNAVKFTDRGGRVDVRLERLDGAARLRVADTGKGISAAFLPHVFELFRQAEPAMTRAQGGLGLGLSICKKLVEMHGGTITADSPGEGRGATFTVELPLTEGASAATSSTPAAGKAGGGAPFCPSPVLAGVRVLVVEDEANTRSVVQWLLEQCGAEVTAVDSAAAAVEAFRAAPGDGTAPGYDVLVSDMAMPVRDGYELLRQVRAIEQERPGTRPVPAVALTAHAREADRDRAAAAGFQTHLPKPVEPGALVNAVARLAGRSGGGA